MSFRSRVDMIKRRQTNWNGEKYIHMFIQLYIWKHVQICHITLPQYFYSAVSQKHLVNSQRLVCSTCARGLFECHRTTTYIYINYTFVLKVVQQKLNTFSMDYIRDCIRAYIYNVYNILIYEFMQLSVVNRSCISTEKISTAQYNNSLHITRTQRQIYFSFAE